MRSPEPATLADWQLSLKTLFASVTLFAFCAAVGSGAFGQHLQQMAGVFLLVLAYGLLALAPVFATAVLCLIGSRMTGARSTVVSTLRMSRPPMAR